MEISETPNGMRVTTFLADMEMLTEEDTQHHRTVREKKFIVKPVIDVLNYPRLWDIFDEEITIEEKMDRVNKTLYFLYRKSKIVESPEDLRKIEWAFLHYLHEKLSILGEYYKDFKVNKINGLEEEREYIMRLMRVKKEFLEDDPKLASYGKLFDL